MKVSELVRKINVLTKNEDDKIRLIQTMLSNRNVYCLFDLDFALFLLLSDSQELLTETEIFALAKSDYARYIAPNFFINDLEIIDEKKFITDLVSDITNRIPNIVLSAECKKTMGEHILSNEIQFDSLLINKANEIAISNNVQIQVKCCKHLSYPLLQTRLSLIEEILITNIGDYVIKNLKLRAKSHSGFIEIADIDIALLNVDEPVSVSKFNITYDFEKFLALPEKMLDIIEFCILSNNTPVVQLTTEIEYYSYDTWLGNKSPETSALFITPNDEFIKNTVRLTAKTLQKQTGSSSLTDYQTNNKDDVISQVKALYDTLYNMGISYITAPASYEEVGQKIRLPHDVAMGKQGTCLDLAFLFCSCVESMGLSPILVLVKGHAYAGVFLTDEHFHSPIIDDAQKMLTMETEKELLLVECKDFTAGSNTNFEQACSHGRTRTTAHTTDLGFLAIDIVLCRDFGYLPLPLAFDDVEKRIVDYDVIKQNKEKLSQKLHSNTEKRITLTKAELGKFDIWEKKLLDLSKRNQLIDFKMNGNGIQFEYYDMNSIYDAFSSKGKSYNIIKSELDVSMYELFELPTPTVDREKHLSSMFNKGLMFALTRKNNHSINKSLKLFERARRTAFEESGSNVLYIAVGFISWFESDLDKKPKHAPIILIPVDIKKQSKDNYSICGREESPFLNISIFEYFHQEFQINFDDLLSMQLFDGNFDAETILNTVQDKLKKIKRTTVIRTAALNVFDFLKAVMWRDIRYRKNELLDNKIVKSIIDGKYVLSDEEKESFVISDDNCDPKDFAIPLYADSSQISAIKDCADGKSFILQGPPGTGKSQTITNMIVNSIYHGKTVLFVAEKMAALEVVQKRLENLSLGEFALEAHSAKADKANIMRQFEKRIALGLTHGDHELFEKTSNELSIEREKVNRIVNLLHKKNNLMLSFYDAFVRYLAIDKSIETISIPNDYMENLTLSEFEKSVAIIINLSETLYAVHGVKDNPFALYGNPNYIPVVSKKTFFDGISNYIRVLSAFIKDYKTFCDYNEFDYNLNVKYVEYLFRLLSESEINLAIVPIIGTSLCLDKNFLSLIDDGCSLQKMIPIIEKQYIADIFSFDYTDFHSQYKTASGYKGLKRKIKIHKLLSKLKKYAKEPKTIVEADIENICTSLELVSSLEKRISFGVKKYESIFNGNIIDTWGKVPIKEFDFAYLKQKIEKTFSIQNNYCECIGFDFVRMVVKKMQECMLIDLNSVNEKYKELFEQNQFFIDKFNFNFSLCEKYGIDYEKMVDLLNGCQRRIDELQNWCAYLQNKGKAIELNLDFLIDYAETLSGQPISDLCNLYCKSVYESIIQKGIMGDDNGSFNSTILSQQIEDYSKTLNNYSRLSVIETAEKVSAHTPLINDDSPLSTEHGILNKAIKNKCRGKSIRNLFEEIQHILTKLFPIFLMSPISCAQYLSPNLAKFDVVIFDEASQMPTSEAVGAIARGKSLIVVGDSKQMPPTSFFKGKGFGEDYIDLDDQESILDDCDVIGLPTKSLLWHYRSKHESLIHFSNAKFYENNLITFPSPNDMISKVSFRKVPGVYGGSKATNKIEADAIVSEIIRRLKSPELSKYSIGVVTFSSVQQELIEDTLQSYFESHTDLEQQNAQSAEPIIIKNLENIQGDERDVILFSVCYGPDKNDNMYYRFGPINNAGGEKRLNVAISRARYEMIVFASFDPERLASMRTESRGAKELYSFLRYAKNGTKSIFIDNAYVKDVQEGFETELARKLKERGYIVETNVGKSSFRVDLGIVDPNNPNQYILGVLCDSYSYENAKTTRDRNIVQPTVLKSIGWNLIRVWSFDYYDNADRVLDNIIQKIEEIQSKPIQYTIPHTQQEKPIELQHNEVRKINYSKEYICYNKIVERPDGIRCDFDGNLEIVKEILDLEAPISEELLYNRFANATGFSRAGCNIKQTVIDALNSLHAKKNQNGSGEIFFFWKNNQSSTLTYYRVGGEKPREFQNIPKEEIFVAIKEVLENHGIISVSELKQCVAGCFGVKAVKRRVSETIEDAIDYYVKKGELLYLENKNKISLRGDVR